MDVRSKYSIKIFLFTLMIFFFSLYLSPAYAESEYYADITIEVDTSGFVTIEGFSNHPDLLVKNTEIYTLKKQSYWLLNITKQEIFNDFIYTLGLPDGSSINYVTSSGSFRIETNNGKLLIRGFGENESISIIVQYQIEKTEDSNNIIDRNPMIVFFIGLIIILLITVILFFIKYKITNKSKDQVQLVDGYDFKGLNQRQKEIMNLLIERKIPLTQTDIQKELKIPKAAVSRNIRGLEIRGLIEKEQSGMSNLIRFKKP